jgi:hypothetical protein
MKALLLTLSIGLFWVGNAAADIIGTASSFGVLAGSAVTNTGTTVVNGNVGVSPSSAITGFPPGLVTPPGVADAGNAVAAQAESDLNTGYNSLAGLAVNSNLTGMDLGGLILTPGVYQFDSSAQLTGTLTLNAEGMANAYWVFQIGSTLTTASASAVNIINGGPNEGVFWQVGSSATLGTTTAFEGNIVAAASITLNTGATISCGRALALSGAVTLDTNAIDNGCSATADSDDGLAGFVANGSGGLSPSPTSIPTPESPFLVFALGFVIAGMMAQRLIWTRATAAASNV